jgi:two-component system sensor histidine kinase MprB
VPTSAGAPTGRGGWRGRNRGPARVEVRSRVALVVALAVVAAVLVLSATAYLVVRHDLLSGVDTTLRSRAATLERDRRVGGLAKGLDGLFAPTSTLSRGPVDQVVESSGVVIAPAHAASVLPVGAVVRDVAAGKRSGYVVSTTIGTTPVRLLVTGFGRGLALELAQPVAGIDGELSQLAKVLVAAAGAGVLLALALGFAVAGLVLRPVRRLCDVAGRLAASHDLSERIPVEGRDELSQLATSMNTVIAALQQSHRSQRQLIADASHELRTPLTSLRTNVEILANGPELSVAGHRQLVSDVVGQLDAMARLIGDLIELARQESTTELGASAEVVELDELADRTLEELRRSHNQVRIVQDLRPCSVLGVPRDLERIVTNLVENAAKWSPVAGTVAVSLGSEALEGSPATALLSVSDEGRGISAEDLPHVFDRFFRGAGGADVAGSGLGLAIVKRIAEAHGGSVSVTSSLGTGSRFELRLPEITAEPGGRGDRSTTASVRRPPA